MEKLSKVMASPSAWDSMANYGGAVPEPEWLCLLSRTRDSDDLSESNFAVALAELGGEGEHVQIFRFGHWACGWIEYLAVIAGTPEAEIASKLYESLQDYPVLDECDLSEREQATADLIWRNCYRVHERVEYIRKHRNQFEFHDYKDMIGCVRGQYFGGYASELVY
jgi:hypothetical protein